MKSFALFSGGKDSFLSITIAQEQGFDVDLCITILPHEDSMMFQYPNVENSEFAASLLGLKTAYEQEERFEKIFKECGGAGYKACVAGAVASEFQKTRIERLCTEAGIVLFSPLWRKSQFSILDELLRRGIHAVIVSASAEGLTEEDLGHEIDEEYIQRLRNLWEKHGVNPTGEGGEFESFVTSYEVTGRKIEIGSNRKKWTGSSGYLVLERLRILTLRGT